MRTSRTPGSSTSYGGSRNRYYEPNHKWKVLGALLAGVPLVLAGLLLLATLYAAPVGLFLILLSGYPLYKVEKNYMERKLQWMMRDQPLTTYDDMGNEVEAPWLSEDEIVLRLRSERLEPDA